MTFTFFRYYLLNLNLRDVTQLHPIGANPDPYACTHILMDDDTPDRLNEKFTQSLSAPPTDFRTLAKADALLSPSTYRYANVDHVPLCTLAQTSA